MKQITRQVSCWVACILTVTSVCADPVWHCSRNRNDDRAAMALPEREDQFSLASFSSSTEVISVSVRDLIDIYTGTPVRIGGIPLSACFLSGNDSLTMVALTSLGIKQSTIEALARKSSIVQSNLYYVSDEAQMSTCIGKNFPAVGYISIPTETDKVTPCF